ncbi:MAG: choice-of-anchor D domain-containing protein [Deltaproteobacteria bacterium]|nr:MAG: choice-of-anchor D domain-containing protein [Deltaproteobacteria bacterium]
MSSARTPSRAPWCVVVLAFVVAMIAGCDCENVQVGQQPKLQVEPKAVVFPVIGVGNEKTQEVRLTNVGAKDLEITSIQLDPDGDPSYTLTTKIELPLVLKPEGSTVLSVKFKPTAAGQPQSAIWIDSNDTEQARTLVPIRTVGNAPRIQVKPPALDFGFVDTNQTETRMATITNVGSATLSLNKLYIQASDKDFTLADQGGTWPLSLAPQKSIQVKVAYRPSNPGADIGELWIESDDPSQPKVRVLLQGQRSEPNISVNPVVLDFGGVPPGKPKNLPLIIANKGGALLTVSKIEKEAGSSADFSFIVPSIPIQIPPGQSVTIATFYSPKDKGRDSGAILIESDDPDSPQIRVTMVGQSPPAGIEVSPLLLDFGSLPPKASRTKALYIVNKGGTPLDLTGLTVKGATQEFQVVSPPTYPHKLNPGSFLTVKVTYSPQSGNSHQGTLEVQSTDPVQSIVIVTLRGAVVPAPPCFLQAKPSLVNFGQVALGKSKQETIDVTNLGSGTCWLFEAGLGPSSNLDFSLASGAIILPVSLGPRGKHTVRVAYTPQQPGPASGNLQIVHGQGLLQRLPALQVPLSAIGAGPRLCVYPNLVDFGAVKQGTAKTESFRIVSCGTEAVTINKILNEIGTSPEYTVQNLPSLPLKLDVNKDISVTVEYKPKDLGFDAGNVEIQSTAVGASKQLVPLRGYGVTSNQQCGALRGRICAPDGNTWLTGAIVSVTVGGSTIQAKTDINGYFYLPCVPDGTHKFDVQKGAFSTSFSATIATGTTNNLQTPQCVDPANTKIAVVEGEYDNVELILNRLKLSYTLYSSGSENQLLGFYNTLKKYDIVFLNCGMDETVLNSVVTRNLQRFVREGGSVWASDFSYDAIEVAWPNAVDWIGDDNTRDAAQKLGAAKVQAKVLNPVLVHRLGGRSQVTVKYDQCPCAGATSAGAGTNVLLEGDRSGKGNPQEPLAIFFKPDPQGGNVVYTTFHNDEQFSRTIDVILRFMIFEL